MIKSNNFYKVGFSMKGMKRLVFAGLFLTVMLMGIGGVSAGPACGLANDNQLIIRLSGASNVHGETWNSGGGYGVEICYNTLFGKEYGGPFYHSQVGNNVVLKLSGASNAHAEGPAGTNYGTGVYYGDLVCTLRNAACSAGEVEVLRLSGTTNAHLAIAGASAYSQRICCSSAFAGIVSCNNECGASGARECSGNGFRICGNYDADSCLEWSSVAACPAGQSCTGGACSALPPTCGDGICSAGEESCTLDNSACPAAPVCQTASCTNGCVNTPLADGPQPGCNTGNMECRSGQCVDTTQPCTLTNAHWHLTNVVEGTTVTMTAVGNNCGGERINFNIYEKDPLFDDFVEVLVDYYPSRNWIAKWTYSGDDDIGNDARDYYFIAELVSDTSKKISSKELTNGILSVNKAVSCPATGCSNNNKCDGIETCVGGVCQQGTLLTCEDNNECTTNSCDPVIGCTFNSVSDGISCGAGTGTCQSGSCVPTTGCANDADCENNNKCDGLSTCNLATGECQPGTPLTCNNGNVCTVDTCDPIIGCTGSPLTCEDNNECTTNSCDPVSECVFTPKSDGAVCSFGTCQGGFCKCQRDADCNDNNQCTANSCNLATGQCSYTTISCSDGNECTTDSCSPSSGCSNTPRTGECGTGGTCNDAGQCIQPLDAYWANETGVRITDPNRLAFVDDRVEVSAKTNGLVPGTTIDFLIQDFDEGVLDADENIRSFNAVPIDANGLASVTWIIQQAEVIKANGLADDNGNDEFDDEHAELYITASASQSGVADDESDVLFVSPESRIDSNVRGCALFTTEESCNSNFDFDPYDSNYDNCGTADINSCTIECSCIWIEDGGGQCALDKQVNDGPDCDDIDIDNGGDGWECIIHNVEFGDCIDGFRRVSTAVAPISNPPAGQCVAEEKQIRCGRAVVQLPFFGGTQFVLSLTAITILYLLMFGRRKEKHS